MLHIYQTLTNSINRCTMNSYVSFSKKIQLIKYLKHTSNVAQDNLLLHYDRISNISHTHNHKGLCLNKIISHAIILSSCIQWDEPNGTYQSLEISCHTKRLSNFKYTRGIFDINVHLCLKGIAIQKPYFCSR